MLSRACRKPVFFPIALATACAFALPARAQNTESLEEPIGDHTGKDVATVNETPHYIIPDFPPHKAPDPDKPLPFIKIKFGLVGIGDWTDFHQDANNIAQIGVQDDEFQVRSARLTVSGSIGGEYRVSFQVSGEYKGFASDPAQDWQLTDAALTFPLGANAKLTVGKTKETFSYEMVGDSANLPQNERVLNPFFVSRNFGFKIIQVLGEDKRATIAVGAFRDKWDFNSTTDRGWDYTVRATGLLWDVPDQNQFFHIGLSYRHVAADGTIRYKGRAETNAGDNAVDTDTFAADNANHFGGEALFNVGPVSFLGEYILAKVHSPFYGDPKFTGWYITGSWVLTGETRPYDRNVGYARRVIPKGRWGAPELVARYSQVDLDDNGINGGSFKKTMLGLNWWATTRWKFGVTWGHTWLDRDGLTGESDTILTRIQWVL
ncbi:hypothetical protein GRI89_06050 [Altererythrobacter salegens]|uniref:Porin n=1 Tax=Croceibacterium salegens TaxID=1737568 RepID=A0A6I4SSX3_9SPHN|nr:porin [Croceibacterium salegens]MXO59101.1 hypothetical protein [Croceibacterium salegens]